MASLAGASLASGGTGVRGLPPGSRVSPPRHRNGAWRALCGVRPGGVGGGPGPLRFAGRLVAAPRGGGAPPVRRAPAPGWRPRGRRLPRGRRDQDGLSKPLYGTPRYGNVFRNGAFTLASVSPSVT